MRPRAKSPYRGLAAASTLCLAALLSACGGGGGSRPVAPGTVTPPPTPTPTPTPTPSPVYDTAEYRRSNAAASAGAIAAYEAGATGAGIKIAIIDSGVDIQSAEFSGRIDAASRDIAGSRSLDDTDGHGTSVAAVALAAKNDSEIHGLAFDATLIALRTDTPGTCASSDGCSHSDTNIATAINVAVAAGARVINMSLGGEPPNSRLRTAIANATAAGVIVVISAGNDGLANPDPFALIAADPSISHGRVIIAGSVDDRDALSSFSNRAGSYAAYYLATLGEDVRSFDHTGTPYYFSGTSYAAPGIAAAVALLADAFPGLSADQIVDLLLSTARDAGTAGDDAVFGQGILDLIRAFAPRGATSLAGSATPVTREAGSLAVLGGALGDGGDLAGALSDVVVLDSYGRAYVADLGAGVSRAAPAPRLAAALQTNTEEARDAFGRAAYSLSWNAAVSTRPWLGMAQTGVDARPDTDARVTRGFVTGKVTPALGIGFAAGYGADDLLASMAGARGRAARFIASGDALRDDGVAVEGSRAAGLTQRVGAWTFGMAAGSGQTESLRRGNRWDQRLTPADDVQLLAASASRRIGAADVTVTWSRLDESGSILGAEGSAALGLNRASSDFLGLDMALDAGAGWRLGVQARGGRTRLDITAGGLISSADALTSSAFAFDVTKADVLTRGDALALRIAQPLRVEGGALRLDVPTTYDYETLTPGYTRRTTTLAPSGREISVEAAWSLPLAGLGRLDTNLFWRRDPGHIATLDDDLGAALRLSARF